MIKLIIFDWDDCITLGSIAGYVNCYHQALVELGVHLEPKEENRRIVSVWGKAHREVISVLLAEKPELIDPADALYQQKFFGDVFIKELRVIDGVPELLTHLHKKYRLAIATGLHPKLLYEKIIPKFHIPHVFSQIISSYDLPDSSQHKPSPYMLEEIMRREHVTKAETVFVGDAKTDMQMAKAAGVAPIAVLSGHMAKEDAQALGVINIPDVSSIETVLLHM